MFDLDRFIEDCCAAVREDPSHKPAREVLVRAHRGTDGSNPAPSCGESAANLISRQIMTAPAMAPFHIRR